MATLSVTQISRAGVEEALTAAAAGGDAFPNDGKTLLVVKNANGAATARTITLDIQKTVDGQDPASRTVSVPALKTYFIGPFPPSIYNDANGRVVITYSASGADLTVGAFRL